MLRVAACGLARARVVPLVVLSLLFVASVSAQEASLAVVTGRVLGSTQEPVGGIEVRLHDAARTVDLRAVSAPDGVFRIERVPAPGTYELECVLGARIEKGPRLVVTRAGEVVSADVALAISLSEEVSVTADAWTLPTEVPNSTSTRTVEQLRQQNLMNPEDALRYVPNTTIRKRYVGDRNALVGGRSFGTLQPSRGLVYLDGYLLSNFLGRFDAPRWNMVTPEALGAGGRAVRPLLGHPCRQLDRDHRRDDGAHARGAWSGELGLTGHSQGFEPVRRRARTSGAASSRPTSGTRFDSGLWGALTFNHQDSTSQPMQYYTVSANATGAFPAVAGAATPVSGILYDVDPKGLRRAVFGGNAGAIDHTKQDSLKLRLGYAITPTLEASALVAGWRNDTANRNETFLRDASGNEVWEGRVTDGVNTFTIPAPRSRRPSARRCTASSVLTLRTRRSRGGTAP